MYFSMRLAQVPVVCGSVKFLTAVSANEGEKGLGKAKPLEFLLPASKSATSPEVPTTTVSKNHFILGLGLPSAMGLPRMRGCWTASFQCVRSNRLSSATGVVDSVSPSATSSQVQPAFYRERILRSGFGSILGHFCEMDEQDLEIVYKRRRKE